MRPKIETNLSIGGSSWITYKKLRPTNSTIGRVFTASFVDCTTNTWDNGGTRSEHPNRSAFVFSDYNRENDAHVQLEDANGVDMMIIRGGAWSKVGVDYNYPTNLIGAGFQYTFTNKYQPYQIVTFPWRLFDNRFILFDISQGQFATNVSGNIDNGNLGDVSFWRRSIDSTIGSTTWTQRLGNTVTLTAPSQTWDAANVYRAITNQYGASDQTSYLLSSTNASFPGFTFGTNWVHWVTDAATVNTGVVAMACEVYTAQPTSGALVLHDPLDPALELCWIEFTAPRAGKIPIRLDFHDQTWLSGRQLWISWKFNTNTVLTGHDGYRPEIVWEMATPAAVRADSLAWRKTLMRHYFQILSEPRPWNSWTSSHTTTNLFMAALSVGNAVRMAQLFNAMDSCLAIDPTDDLIRQYGEWVRKRDPNVSMSTVSLTPPPAGVPSWAWWARMAWLEQRRIAEWCMDNRMNPNGELGGSVADDSDWYAQMADLPMFETNGVGLRLKTNGAALYQLAHDGLQYRAFYLTNGMNNATKDSLHAYEEGINLLGFLTSWNYGDPVLLAECMKSAFHVNRQIVFTNGGFFFRNNAAMGWSQTNASTINDGYATSLSWHAGLQALDYNRNTSILTNITNWANSWIPYLNGSNVTELRITNGVAISSGGYSLSGYGQSPVFCWLSEITSNRNWIETWIHDYTNSTKTYPATYEVDTAYSLGWMDSYSSVFSYWSTWNNSIQTYTSSNFTRLTNMLLYPTDEFGSHVSSLEHAFRWPRMQTEEQPYPDRIDGDILEWPSRAYLGGYRRRNEFMPKAAVSWEGFSTNYAALCLKNRKNKVTFDIYSFDNSTMNGAMRLWKIERGTYRVTIGLDAGTDFKIDTTLSVTTNTLQKGDAVSISLAPATNTIVDVEMITPLTDIYNFADAGLSSSYVGISGSSVTGIVWNVGKDAFTNCTVGLYETNGSSVGTATVSLTAPGAFATSTNFSISFTGASRPFDIILNPSTNFSEIYMGNNTVRVQ